MIKEQDTIGGTIKDERTLKIKLSHKVEILEMQQESDEKKYCQKKDEIVTLQESLE